MTEKEVQKAAGKKFSKEQRDQLGFHSWVNAHKDLLMEVQRDQLGFYSWVNAHKDLLMEVQKNPDTLAALEHICRIGQSKKPEK